MTILSVVRDVCAAVGVMVPQSIFSGIQNNRTMQEMVSLANEMAQRIAYDTRDWTELKSSYDFIGDGHFEPPEPDPNAVWTGTSAFPLPPDYKRLLLTSNVRRSTTPSTPMLFVPDIDEWVERRMTDYNCAQGEWMIANGKMHIWPTMAGYIPEVPAVPEDPGPPYVPPVLGVPAVPAVKATFVYLEKNCVRLHGVAGQHGDVFMNDDDTYRLDERLLKLGMIWQWRENKGSPYAEAMGTYSDALANAMGHDSPAPILIGRRPMQRGSIGANFRW